MLFDQSHRQHIAYQLHVFLLRGPHQRNSSGRCACRLLLRFWLEWRWDVRQINVFAGNSRKPRHQHTCLVNHTLLLLSLNNANCSRPFLYSLPLYLPSFFPCPFLFLVSVLSSTFWVFGAMETLVPLGPTRSDVIPRCTSDFLNHSSWIMGNSFTIFTLETAVTATGSAVCPAKVIWPNSWHVQRLPGCGDCFVRRGAVNTFPLKCFMNVVRVCREPNLQFSLFKAQPIWNDAG